MEEILEMSRRELERIKILAQVIDGKITQLTATKILKLSDRQVRNLLVELKTNGEKGIISRDYSIESLDNPPNGEFDFSKFMVGVRPA